MIETKNLRFSYGKTAVLNDINLKIEKGSFVAVVGANGSGKSTLSKHFNALLLPSLGTVYVGGIDTKDESRLFDVRSSVGMVFQNPDNQMVTSIVEDEAAFGPENLGVEPKEIRRRIDDALRTVGLEKYAKKSVSELSGGQKQRLAIASALAMEPDCIVFDEATSMLDPSGRAEVLDEIRKLKKRGLTAVLITHYMDEAAQADRIIVMNGGEIVLDGEPDEVFAQAEQLKEIGLDLPQTAELAYELRKSGISVPVTSDTDALINAIVSLAGGAAHD